MLPRLTEVFVLRESSVGNISRLLGFPKDFQTDVQKTLEHDVPGISRYLFTLVKLFRDDMKKGVVNREDTVDELKFSFLEWLGFGMTERGPGKPLLDFLKKNPGLEKKISQSDGSEMALEKIGGDQKKIKDRAEMTFPMATTG